MTDPRARKSHRGAALLAAAVLILHAGSALSGWNLPAPYVHYQGQLKNQGQPFHGEVDLTFSLWSGDMFGNQIGATVTQTVNVHNGLFQVELYFGPVTGWDEQRYLELAVDGHVLTPRQPIRPVPHALYAYELFQGSPSVIWQRQENDIYYSGGHVGIGTTQPLRDLHIENHNASLRLEGTSGSSSFVRFVRGGVNSHNDDWNYIALSAANGSLVTRVGGIDRFRIMTNGNVGVGTNNPQARLHVYGTDAETIAFQVTVDGDARMVVHNDFTLLENQLATASSVYIGDYPAGGAHAVCRMTSGSDPVGYLALCSSSARYKEDITELDRATGLVEQLRAVRYRWIDSGEQDVGLIAEEVAAIAPHLATYGRDGRVEGVKYERLSAVLIAALQETRRQAATEQAVYAAELAALRAELEQSRDDAEQRLVRLEKRLFGDER